YIGTNASGTASIANSNWGVEISNGVANTIGGSTAAARNIVSGNGRDGIGITGNLASNNLVMSNCVGLDANGNSLGNALSGVYIEFGGHDTVQNNVISGNHGNGVLLRNSTTANLIAGNLIGTDATGTQVRGNSQTGVYIDTGANANTIGGGTSAARN